MPKARHPKAATCVKQSLFAGLMNFAELEARIAALPDDQSRGGAFEVFAEAYLATQRKHDAAEVWPLTSVPTHILQTLGLAPRDYGVDGVFKTLLGNFSAYQVKFRTNRPALTWRELSTFMGLADSPHIRSRVLLTNCDDLPSVLNERQGFFCIRGSDLDRLEPGDFRAIEAWLADAAFVPPKKQPQPHQTEALDALLPALQTHDRVSAIMACGTGKTLVALWVAERRQASRILVLVPSLALLRQTLHEWLRETSLPSLAYHCVCSDPTVKEGIDAIATAQSDLDFQVSTDAASVRGFLDAPFDGTKIIFSTYQSAQVVGAALKPGEAFDLAVFDEAHKTAGREGRNYAFALEDTNLPIRKRLFLTATPRHYNPHQHDREGDAQLVFSMDRPEVYGPQAFRLTFAEAARRGIICGYKVIISVITSEMVTNELLSHGEVEVNGDAVRARQVANQIALRDAIEKYGVKKIFTFHSTVKSAASFVADGPEGIRTHLSGVGGDVRRLTSRQNFRSHWGKKSQSLVTSSPTKTFQAFHVNGTMPTARREHEMRDFRAAASAVMSNARCLTEGVDVPAVDMVAFLSPRRSRVDIVQATGRAMRRSPGKTTGYVLVPLYVELAAGETVEAAVNRAKFDEVWDVLQSLQEQDDMLAEIIREMREQSGRTNGVDDNRFGERIHVLGPQISVEELRKTITTACIEALGDSWDERFGQLKAFKERFGHCDVPVKWAQNTQLAGWVNNQRQRRRMGTLSAGRIHRLDQISFNWNPFEASWEEFYVALVDYKKVHGDCDVPAKWPENPAFGRWVSTQRKDKKNRKISQDRVQRLEEIGFVWDIADTSWEEMHEALLNYRKIYGDCNVPARWIEKPALGRWVSEQRKDKRINQLSAKRMRRLDTIGFAWELIETNWQAMFAALLDYKSEFGDCDVPLRWSRNRGLGSWVSSQRLLRNNGKLTQERIRQLDQAGFVWDPVNSNWDKLFSELAAYTRKHGDCNVPQKWPENQKLGTWVGGQRKLRMEGKLNPERTRRLDELGFVWDVGEATWETMFAELVAYKRRHDDCNVPNRWPENPTFGHWVLTQRTSRRKGKLSKRRMQRLNRIGFVWDPLEAEWEAMFAALVEYKRVHGDCKVPAEWPKDRRLGMWVGTQRRRRKESKLSKERIARLNKLEFVWDKLDAAWEDRFCELVEYKDTQGHCNVPVGWSENPELAIWVARQRQFKRIGRLSRQRIERLSNLGLAWNVAKSKWDDMFDILKSFRDEQGHCNVPQKWRKHLKLGAWVSTQRSLKKSGDLSRERIQRLDDIDFQWKIRSTTCRDPHPHPGPNRLKQGPK